MRVLLVSNHGADRTYGGTERYVADLEAALVERGHAVSLLSAFPVRDGSADRTVTLHATDWREDPVRRARNHLDDWVSSPGRRLGETIARSHADIVHTSNLPGIATGVWEQARRHGMALVHTLHDYQLLCPRTTLLRPDGRPCRPHPLLCGLRTRRLARWAPAVDAVIGVSGHVLGRHAGFFPPATARRVIRPPVVGDIAAGAPPPAGGPRSIGYLGALQRFKGVETLLAAAPRLASRGIAVRIAGDGPLAERVRAADGVEYRGRIGPSEIAPFMAGCDLGIVPSLWEEPGFSYAACEWLAAGRPVLLTRRGGLAETAALGGTAAFDGTVEGLLGAVATLGAREAWQRLLGTIPAAPGAGRELDRWAEQHLEVYAIACAGRRA